MSPIVQFVAGLLLLVLFGWYFSTDKDRVKRTLGSLLTVLLTALAIAACYPPFDVPKVDAKGGPLRDERGRFVLEQTGKIPLGIDLKGGTSFLLSLQPGKDDEGNPRMITPDAVDRAIEAFRKRVDALGTSEPIIAPVPPNKVLVQLPGADIERVTAYREALRKVAKLEFRMVHPDSDMLVPQIELGQQIIPPGYEIVDYIHTDAGKEVTTKLIVSKKVEIKGDKVSGAGVTINNGGKFEIALEFNSEGAKQFADVTARMAKSERYERFAVLMDKVCIQAAGLSPEAKAGGGIAGGRASITGDFTEKEARTVASSLLNPLENETKLEEERTTSAALGQDAIQSGIQSGLVAAALTFVLVLLYYRFAGLVANFALVIFIVLLAGAMGMFHAVLTLPGIAGILLTLGMAIDANVLIYERLREEQAAGKSLGAALNAAYEKAFSAIFDSNVTTLITAAILFWKATGPVKGFAVSLVIGVIASMFTALVVTRNLFTWAQDTGIMKKITMANIIPATRFNFLGWRRSALMLSLLVIAGCAAIFVARGDKNFGVDFKGGDRLVMEAEGVKPSLDAIRKELSTIGFSDATVQTEQAGGKEYLVIRDKAGSAEKISPHLMEKFVDAKLKQENIETVGGLVGKQLASNSLWALGMGMIGILIYVTLRFELSFAVGALVALLHDVFITVGVFSLLGRELTLVTVGAILTIAGYSVNDTIVVFDRIREGIKSGRSGTIVELMNASINETLSRTILTGGITFITTIILYIYGGPVLNDFALTMMIGILVGTYSSIFIAAPIVLWWSGRGGRDLKSEVKRGDEEAVVPA